MVIPVPTPVVVGLAAGAVLIIRWTGSRCYRAGYLDGLSVKAKLTPSGK